MESLTDQQLLQHAKNLLKSLRPHSTLVEAEDDSCESIAFPSPFLHFQSHVPSFLAVDNKEELSSMNTQDLMDRADRLLKKVRRRRLSEDESLTRESISSLFS